MKIYLAIFIFLMYIATFSFRKIVLIYLPPNVYENV